MANMHALVVDSGGGSTADLFSGIERELLRQHASAGVGYGAGAHIKPAAAVPQQKVARPDRQSWWRRHA
eukprot:SAG31_NODE_28491_length_409_cov_1.190323_1_plen_68_part_01